MSKDDVISREMVLAMLGSMLHDPENDKIVQMVSLDEIANGVLELPSVNLQEPNMTWVTGADGAKIAFKDVPVWKVTKICEILGEPQERSDKE